MRSLHQFTFATVFAAGAAIAAALVSSTCVGQAYASKPVRIIVPFGAGGITDVVTRIIGQKLSENLQQPVIIDNRPGAGGNVAEIGRAHV